MSGAEALQTWMQALSDKAVDELGQTHFDTPEVIRTLECRIAPTHDGGIYYTSPSDDFSRPGRMWWSVPVGVTRFTTWRETTTVYHEGVPGHHLQLGQAVYNRATLNTYRRSVAGTSGHAEGWALYAERLMDELGYLSDPGDRLGMLDGQRMRAARLRQSLRVHERQREHGRGVHPVRSRPVPGLAGAGTLVQGRSTHLGGAQGHPSGARGRIVRRAHLPQ